MFQLGVQDGGHQLAPSVQPQALLLVFMSSSWHVGGRQRRHFVKHAVLSDSHSFSVNMVNTDLALPILTCYPFYLDMLCFSKAICGEGLYHTLLKVRGFVFTVSYSGQDYLL